MQPALAKSVLHFSKNNRMTGEATSDERVFVCKSFNAKWQKMKDTNLCVFLCSLCAFALKILLTLETPGTFQLIITANKFYDSTGATISIKN